MTKDITDIDSLKKRYSDPSIFIPDQQKLSEYEELLNSSKKLTPQQLERKTELTQEIAMIYGLKNSTWTANLDRDRYSASLAKLRKDIVEDFDCRNSLELMLADRIVAHYWRAMRNDAAINRLVEEKEGGYTFNQIKINTLRALHKGVELADRQLTTNTILLKELKQPQLNIKVTTKNAFISQNQQINTENKNNEA